MTGLSVCMKSLTFLLKRARRAYCSATPVRHPAQPGTERGAGKAGKGREGKGQPLRAPGANAAPCRPWARHQCMGSLDLGLTTPKCPRLPLAPLSCLLAEPRDTHVLLHPKPLCDWIPGHFTTFTHLGTPQ